MCVETQPGLTEMYLNVQPAPLTAAPKTKASTPAGAATGSVKSQIITNLPSRKMFNCLSEALINDVIYRKTPNLSRGLNEGYFWKIELLRSQYWGCGLN